MRAVVQRVTSASVTVEGETVGAVGPGLMVLIGVSREDTDKDLKYIVDKVQNLRVFDDENGVMNRSILDAGGSILAAAGLPTSRLPVRKWPMSCTSGLWLPGGIRESMWKPAASGPR